MANLRLLRGPLLVLLYQVAPITSRQDSLGRYRVTVGFGGGQWENEQFSCEGDLISANPVRYSSGGAQVDAWPGSRLRLTGFGGVLHQTADFFSADYSGGFGGGQVAYEGQHIGLGFGLTHVSGLDGFTAPVPYFRIGNIDRPHFRIDALAPNPAFSTAGWARIGMGFNNGHLRGTSGFFGLGARPPDYNSKALAVGEFRFPIARRLTVQVQGLVGPGERTTQWATGFGLRYDFRRK